MQRSFLTTCVITSVGCALYIAQLFFGVGSSTAASVPLVNYYLGELNNSSEFIETMSKFDILILTPSQIKTHASVVSSIKIKNSDILIFAYIPSQSYNTQYWPRDTVFKYLQPKENWWLRDSSGNPISHWVGLQHTNMSEEWMSDLLVFVDEYVLSLDGVDGIFFDMVSHNISWLNGGNIDIDRNGKKDTASTLDQWWKDRTGLFLRRARERFGDTVPIIINGTSDTALQSSINGRMFETFPTPWEGNGSWEVSMNAAKTIQKKNLSPRITIFNGNTNNSGERQRYDQVRFGLVSSLLLDNVYFSYDFGDTNHGQTWWYDEYDVDLGDPAGSATSPTGQTSFAPGIWQREFAQGIALVNSGKQSSKVTLPGEYEKIRGTQDASVNDGSIVSSVTVPAQDGLLLLRTLQRLDNIVFTNGDFARFFKKNGDRVRNGFFLYDSAAPGGAQVGRMDIDGNGLLDTIIVTKNRVTVRRDNGKYLARFRPYGALFSSGLRITFGDINNDGKKEMAVAPASGKNPIKIYSYNGTQIGDDWYPFGTTYNSGYSVAISTKQTNSFMAVASKDSTITVFDAQTRKKIGTPWKAFTQASVPYVAIGNIDAQPDEEIVVGAGKGSSAMVKVFSNAGAPQSQFIAYSTIVSPGLPIQLADVDTDGTLDIVTLSSGF